MSKVQYRTVKVLDSDYKKLTKWAAQRDMYIYEVISSLIK